MSLRPSTARRHLDAITRAEDAVRRANVATATAEGILHTLKTELIATRADLAEEKTANRQLKVQVACWHERAETMARAEEHSYALAGARADQLRRYGYIPVEEIPA